MFDVFKSHKWWFVLILGFIILYIILIIYMTFPITQYSIEKAGQFGDSFGVLNSLFSGLAFIALIITIYLQQQDMRDSKKEVQKQNFENKFFKLITLHNESKTKFNWKIYKDKDNINNYFGDSALFHFYNKFKEQKTFEQYLKSDVEVINNQNEKKIKENRNKYEKHLRKYLQIALNSNYNGLNLSFLENIYYCLELIKRNEKILDEDKYSHIDILLSQIGEYELLIIFYYTLAFKKEKKSLLEEYHFFKTINKKLLYDTSEEDLYEKKIFSHFDVY